MGWGGGGLSASTLKALIDLILKQSWWSSVHINLKGGLTKGGACSIANGDEDDGCNGLVWSDEDGQMTHPDGAGAIITQSESDLRRHSLVCSNPPLEPPLIRHVSHLLDCNYLLCFSNLDSVFGLPGLWIKNRKNTWKGWTISRLVHAAAPVFASLNARLVWNEIGPRRALMIKNDRKSLKYGSLCEPKPIFTRLMKSHQLKQSVSPLMHLHKAPSPKVCRLEEPFQTGAPATLQQNERNFQMNHPPPPWDFTLPSPADVVHYLHFL